MKRRFILTAGLLSLAVAIAAGQTMTKKAGAAPGNPPKPKKILCGTQIVILEGGTTVLPQVPSKCNASNKVRWVIWNFDEAIHSVEIAFKENKDCAGGRKYPTTVEKPTATVSAGEAEPVKGDIGRNVVGACPAKPDRNTAYFGSYIYDVWVDKKLVAPGKVVPELQVTPPDPIIVPPAKK